MRPVTLSVTGVGSSQVCPMDIYLNPFNVGIGVRVEGTITYTVQYTFEDVFSPSFNPATATWFDHSTLVNISASDDGNIAFAVRGVRLTTSVGTGTATMTAVQSGVANG